MEEIKRKRRPTAPVGRIVGQRGGGIFGGAATRAGARPQMSRTGTTGSTGGASAPSRTLDLIRRPSAKSLDLTGTRAMPTLSRDVPVARMQKPLVDPSKLTSAMPLTPSTQPQTQPDTSWFSQLASLIGSPSAAQPQYGGGGSAGGGGEGAAAAAQQGEQGYPEGGEYDEDYSASIFAEGEGEPSEEGSEEGSEEEGSEEGASEEEAVEGLAGLPREKVAAIGRTVTFIGIGFLIGYAIWGK